MVAGNVFKVGDVVHFKGKLGEKNYTDSPWTVTDVMITGVTLDGKPRRQLFRMGSFSYNDPHWYLSDSFVLKTKMNRYRVSRVVEAASADDALRQTQQFGGVYDVEHLVG